MAKKRRQPDGDPRKRGSPFRFDRKVNRWRDKKGRFCKAPRTKNQKRRIISLRGIHYKNGWRDWRGRFVSKKEIELLELKWKTVKKKKVVIEKVKITKRIIWLIKGRFLLFSSLSSQWLQAKEIVEKELKGKEFTLFWKIILIFEEREHVFNVSVKTAYDRWQQDFWSESRKYIKRDKKRRGKSPDIGIDGEDLYAETSI